MAAQSILLPPDELVSGDHARSDPPSVRLLKVPEAAPPFDPEVLPAAGPPGPEFPVWAAPAPVPAPPAALEARDPAGDWAREFAWLLAETLAGVRPERQLLPWLADRGRVHLRRAVAAFRCAERPRVLRVHASWPAEGVAELSVTVGLGPRTRALAIRLEKAPPKPGQPPRWLCTDIETA